MKTYMRMELLRTLRDPFYLFLAVVVPIGFYLLFSGLFGSETPPGQLSGNIEIMVALAVYGGIWACLVATGPRLANERSSGWFRQLSLLPLAPWKILLGRMLVAILFALPAMLLIYATAIVVHGVQMTAIEWLGVIALMWIGVWPFALLGIALGYVTNDTTSFGVTYGLYMVFSAAGGLWVPPTILPSTMLSIAKTLPTYQAADLGWRIADGLAPAWTSAIVLVLWALGFLLVAALFARRAARVR
ncbi:MAG TPA: ABC transporter permease [Ktedonobacterales bacterium]|nr:ABC transporter permease [Ktedonobacterales bacterium]